MGRSLPQWGMSTVGALQVLRLWDVLFLTMSWKPLGTPFFNICSSVLTRDVVIRCLCKAWLLLVNLGTHRFKNHLCVWVLILVLGISCTLSGKDHPVSRGCDHETVVEQKSRKITSTLGEHKKCTFRDECQSALIISLAMRSWPQLILILIASSVLSQKSSRSLYKFLQNLPTIAAARARLRRLR